MLADLEHLIELQQVDLRLLELTRQIELFPRQRSEAEAELAQARQALEQVRARHTDLLKQRKRLEIDVQQFDERIGKHRQQIYEVKSNEAYRALQHEIDEEENRKTQAEDRVLEAMIAAEETEKEIKKAEGRLKEVEKRVAELLERLDAEKRDYEKQAAALSSERDQLRAQIGPDNIVMYDRIAQAHGGIALAQARDEVCQVCRIHIRPQTFTEVKRNDRIYYCESCHRILYYRPAETSGAEPALDTAPDAPVKAGN